ncbi:hypothetical protein [Phosphitispora fastidiosa]|uniref:hypothetical protein n=1 Tax=Phosphitispora fastidiosa TaxID=2837202 RepID=UPI001E52BEA4|nr:hypothetical protein [Phosphitispora fastidiosa]MBU7005521.1 hypothetical protein [Phosphitispora fastidiosa]
MSLKTFANKSIRTLLLCITAAVVLAVAVPLAAEADTGRKKAVVLIVDNIALQDLSYGNLPNFRKTIDSGGVGLLNTRVQSYTERNRASAYLSIGMGVRTYLDTAEVAAKNGKPLGSLYEITVENAADLREIISRDFSNYVFGQIGETARQHGFRTAIVGNADTDREMRESTLLATDNKGKISCGNVDEDLLIKDEKAPWGHRTNPERLLADSVAAMENSDLIFIDFGDTARVYEAQQRLGLKGDAFREAKLRALTNADKFLGDLLREMDDSTVLAVISPTPPDGKGASALTPIIIYDKNTPVSGVLVSDTTKRIGLTANIDIGPTLFDRLISVESNPAFVGEGISAEADNDNLNTVSGSLSRFIHLNRSRYVVHGLYTFLLVYALAALFMPLTGRKVLFKPRAGRAGALMVLALPVVVFVVYSLVRDISAVRYYLDALLTILITAALGIVLSKSTDRTLAGMAALSLAAAVFLVTDLLTGYRYIINTPLGFDNVFMGGRYYGINNDCMGILLGSSVFALFYMLEKFKIGRYLRLVLVFTAFIPIILSQIPGNGSNVGGTIAAMSTAIIALLALVSHYPVKKRRLFLAVIFVFLLELFIAYLDYLFGGQTHAGKVMGALISEGFGSKFMEVLISKLTLFAITLALPPWNALFVVQLYIYYFVIRKQAAGSSQVREHFPLLFRAFEVILYGGIIAFLFNDTGLIATGLMFTYMTMPMGVLAVENDIFDVYTCRQKQRI